MVLGYLMQNSPHWQQVEINIKMVVPSKSAADITNNNLTTMLSNMRIGFKTHVIVSKGEVFWDILKRESSKSDLVMLGLKTPDQNFSSYFEKLKSDTKDIKRKIFVLAAQDIEFKDVLT